MAFSFHVIKPAHHLLHEKNRWSFYAHTLHCVQSLSNKLVQSQGSHYAGLSQHSSVSVFQSRWSVCSLGPACMKTWHFLLSLPFMALPLQLQWHSDIALKYTRQQHDNITEGEVQFGCVGRETGLNMKSAHKNTQLSCCFEKQLWADQILMENYKFVMISIPF